MEDERTPLIQTVYVRQPPRRYANHTCRRFCTIALSSILIASFFTFIVGLIVDVPGHLHWPPSNHGHGKGNWLSKGGSLTHEELQAVLFGTPTTEQAEEWSRYYTAGPHLAGQNYSQAAWTQEKWTEWGIKSDIIAYDVYLNYPKDHALSLLTKNASATSGKASWKIEFAASLEEDVLKQDPTSGLSDRVPTFHGYSANGNVTAPFVYVNYGTYQDFEDLRRANVSLDGKIAIARYGGIFRGLKVKRAQEMGAIGCILYSDPGDDGDVTDENGVAQYPKGPARNPSSVQRGSTQYISVRPGDPTTPGYPSKPGVPRVPVDDATPSIPSIPISYADALPLLKALNGHGPLAKDLGKFWNSRLGLSYLGVDYNIGPSPDSVVINLYNEVEYKTTPLWNVIGIVNGTIPNEVIVVGNHRDAWIAGGAGDPNSGSAVLNEVVRSVGKALEAGWKPMRTIVFASWDGEEYALIGSTEWVEEYLPWIHEANVAYVNVDVGVKGPNFSVAAAPLLNRVLRDVVHMVPSPNQTVDGQTVGDVWDGRIRTMGSGSDFTAFQDFAGVPSIDMGFGGGDEDAVYHYHSNYDSFYWMQKYGDPGFVYHQAMARVLGLMVGELSNKVVVQFNATEYADALDAYLDKVEAKLSASLLPIQLQQTVDLDAMSAEAVFELRSSRAHEHDREKGDSHAFRRSLDMIRATVKQLRHQTVHLDGQAAWAEEQLAVGIPWWKWWESIRLGFVIARVNKSYKMLERSFLYQGGLDGRSWFKHVVFAPGLWTGYSGAVYPGLMESIDTKDFINAMKWSAIINECVANAIKSLS